MTDEKKLEEAIAGQIKSFDGEIGIVIQGIKSKFRFAYNENRLMSTASAAKVFVLGALLELCEQNKISLDKMITFHREAVEEGSGILCHMSDGMKLCVKDVAMLMIILSDNTATNLLIDLVGGTKAIARHLERYEVKDCFVNRKISSDDAVTAKCNFADATAAGFADYLWKIKNGMILSPHYAAVFKDMMSRQFYKDMFGRKLPLKDYYDDPNEGSAELSNKTGFMTGIRTDVGYISIEGKGEYVYSVLINGCGDRSYAAANEASVLIAEIGLQFYKMICEQK